LNEASCAHTRYQMTSDTL